MIEMLLTGNSEPVNDEEKYLAFMQYMNGRNLSEVDMSFLLNNTNGLSLKVNLGMGSENADMLGSPWNGGVPGGSANTGRVIRHLCPSEDVFVRLVKEKRDVMLQFTVTLASKANVTIGGITRNGYTSKTTTIAKGFGYITFNTNPSLVYYDSSSDELYSMFGSGKTGPTVFTIPS